MNNNVEEQELNNDGASLNHVISTLTLYSNKAVNFIKNILFKNNLEYESSLKVIIEAVKNIQLIEHKLIIQSIKYEKKSNI